jgi:hypothetical protein
VCSRFAALDETCKYGQKFGSVDQPDAEQHKDDFLKALSKAWSKNQVLSPEEIAEANEYHSWASVAKEWSDHLKEKIEWSSNS